MNKEYLFERAWIDGRWQSNVGVQIDETGLIQAVLFDVAGSQGERVGGLVMPGVPNVHSHAFQWTFAGCSEFRTGERDSFWSWRELMYASLQDLDPDEYFERARLLYRMMRRAGYTSVGEFHYIHVQADGRPYDDISAMSEAVVRAAISEGLAICILPVLYQRGGFNDGPLSGPQVRFALSDEQFFQVCSSLQERHGSSPDVSVGMAFHSLRAVDPRKLSRMASSFRQICPHGPIHIHVAEQTREVDDCLAVCNARPVELLYQSADIDDGWCLIHATHLSDQEIGLIANSGATVGLCPMTEANLGDGIFPAEEFVKQNGRIAIGSDSHVSINPFSEMRMIEYGQRLQSRKRAVLCTEEQSCGEFLYESVVEHGANILGLKSGKIAVGFRADLMVLNPQAITGTTNGDTRESESLLIDRAIFCEFGPIVTSTLSCGRWITH